MTPRNKVNIFDPLLINSINKRKTPLEQNLHIKQLKTCLERGTVEAIFNKEPRIAQLQKFVEVQSQIIKQIETHKSLEPSPNSLERVVLNGYSPFVAVTNEQTSEKTIINEITERDSIMSTPKRKDTFPDQYHAGSS